MKRELKPNQNRRTKIHEVVVLSYLSIKTFYRGCDFPRLKSLTLCRDSIFIQDNMEQIQALKQEHMSFQPQNTDTATEVVLCRMSNYMMILILKTLP